MIRYRRAVHGRMGMTRIGKAITVQLLWMLVLTVSLAGAQVQAPAISPSPPEPPAGAPVIFSGETLFTVYDKLGSFGPQDRATAIAERLSRLAKDPLFRLETIAVVEGERTSEIVSGDVMIAVVTDGEAGRIGRLRQEIAEQYVRTIRRALATEIEKNTGEAMLMNGAYALLDTVIFIAFLIAFYKLFPKLYEKILSWRGTYIPPIKIQRVEVLSADQLATGIIALAKGLRVFATLFLLYMCG